MRQFFGELAAAKKEALLVAQRIQSGQLRSSLGLFSRAFPGPIMDVQPEEIDAWLRGGDLAPVTRNLDGIPFRKSLQFDMELISWHPTTLTYAATTYWDAFPGTSSNVAPQPREAAAPVPTLADAIAANAPPRKRVAIECETMKVVSQPADKFVGEQEMAAFGGERWSNGRHWCCRRLEPGPASADGAAHRP